MSAVLPVHPYLDQDFYVPAYKIVVRNQELLEETYDITSVTYTESLTALDSFDLTVNNNWEPSRDTFKYSDELTFRPWSPVELWMGYFQQGEDQRKLMLKGEITTMAPNYPASGGPTLTVRGLNLLHRFRVKQETQSFFKKKETEVAVDLVKRIDEGVRRQFPGLKVEIDPEQVKLNLEREKPIDFLVVQNQYPIVFLFERARRIGYELSIKRMTSGATGEVVFSYGPSKDVKRATYILKWGETLISAQPTLRTADQVNKVTVRGWSPGGKQPITKSVTRDDIRREGVVHPQELDLAEPALAEEITVDQPVSSAAEAEDLAKSILKQKASELVVVKAKTIGLPDLRAGSKVQLLGLGERFSGKKNEPPFLFLVTDTTHTFGDGGYTTDFTARMEAGVAAS
jgi:uncharacterized protein